MKNIYPLLLLTLLVQCHRNETNQQGTTGEADKFFVIDYEEALQNKKTINLSEIAAEVKYIPLQTDSHCLLCRKPEYHFTDQYILIENRDHVLVYDYTGKFIRQIGTPGKGPHEVDLIRMISVNEKDKTIAIQTNWSRKLLFFSMDGTFLESIPVPDIHYLNAIEKDKFLSYDFGAGGFEDYVFRLTNRNNDTISTVNNHFKWQNNTGRTFSIGYWVFHPFYTYKQRMFCKSMYNDTVYSVDGNIIKPAYFIDLGQYRLPNEMRPENPATMDAFRRGREDHFFATTTEAKEQVFVTTSDYGDSIRRNILFNKMNGEGTFLVKKYGEPAGFINDWDGGPEFWPEGNVNDQTVFMTVSPTELKNIIEDEGFVEKTAQNPESKKKFEEMVKNLDENDNPVIMLVNLKP